MKNEIANNVFRSASSLAAFENFLRALPHATQRARTHVPALPTAKPRPGADNSVRTAAGRGGEEVVEEAIEKTTAPIRRDVPKVGRNEPCPCGSGKKYKNCCGRNA